MNFDNFTIKSQEVVQQAVQTAQQNGNQAIEPEHLLKRFARQRRVGCEIRFPEARRKPATGCDATRQGAVGSAKGERRRTLPVARVKRCVAESHRLRKAAR